VAQPVLRASAEPRPAVQPAAAVQVAVQVPPAPPVPAVQAAPTPQPVPQGRLIAAPVLAIADSIPPSPGTVQCARCQGQNDASARFCKYCGSPLTARVTPDQAPHDAALAGAVVQAPAPRAAPAPSGGVAALDVPATIQTRAPLAPQAVAPQAAGAQALVAQPAPATPRTAGAAAAGHARLVVVTEDGSDGKSFELDQPTVTIGRTEGDIILSDDPYVSPRHARLEQVGGVWQVDDLGSLNGVFVRVKGRRPLQKDDLILLGSQVLQFEPVNDEERQLGPMSQHGTRIFGTKPVRRLARLDQRTTAGLVGDVYYVHRDETTLGRELGDIVFTADAFLSRRHAMLRREPASGEFTLEDLDSSNGTFIAIRGRSAIEQGDRIRIGQHLFRFEQSAVQARRSGRGGPA
jgi:pSer/pThr/pTyr-binding forkhead associated (FHA) protein